MAVQFHELPPEAFPEESRPYISRLNRELRELFALEGTIRSPRATRRSDRSIARRGEVQVDVSRITPSIEASISGSSTVIGTPALTFGTVNTVGTTRTVVSVNSAIALFNTSSPADIAATSSVGVAAVAARQDHVHAHPVLTTGDLHTDLLPLSGVRDMTGELGTDIGDFRSDVASGGVAFDFNTSNSFTSGTLWRLRENAGSPSVHEITFEGHVAYGIAPNTGIMLNVSRILVDDSRATLIGTQTASTVDGNITGAIYSPTITGGIFSAGLQPDGVSTTLGTGSRTVRGGVFQAVLGVSAASRATTANCKAYGGQFSVTESVAMEKGWGEVYGGLFTISGSFASGLTNSYGIRVDSISAGLNRWGLWASNKVHCDASDFIANTNAKGYITKDSQSTPRFWRMYTDAASGTTGGVTIAIDAAGTITATRVTGATGTINFVLEDVGTAAPTQ